MTRLEWRLTLDAGDGDLSVALRARVIGLFAPRSGSTTPAFQTGRRIISYPNNQRVFVLDPRGCRLEEIVAHITREQMELLEEIVDAYWTTSDSDQKNDFFVYTAAGVGTTIQHAALKDGPHTVEAGERSVDAPDLEELDSLGLIRLADTSRKGAMHPTVEGKRVVEEHRQKESIIRADTVISSDGGAGISWEDTLPVLQAVVDLYPQAPPALGVPQGQVNERLGRSENDPDTGRKYEMLEQAEYIKGFMETDQTPGPLMAAPTEKALQLLAGWPADGAVALERLLSILDSRIAATSDEAERSKLQAFRDAAQNLGQNVAAQVMTKLIMGEMS